MDRNMFRPPKHIPGVYLDLETVSGKNVVGTRP